MEIKPVRKGFAVTAQFAPEEMAKVAKAGYVAVICNRPDGEDADQPSIAAMRAAAEAAGIAYHHIPVSGGAFPPAAIAAFGAVRKGTTGPVLAHCRTGTRSITLEALANPLGLSATERLADAAAAGYDLSALADRLD